MGVEITGLDTRANAETGMKFVPKHPKTGKLLACYLVLRGEDSQSYRQQLNERRRERLERSARLQAQGQPLDHLDPEELDRQRLESLVSMTVGFGGWDLNGTELPFSQQNARLLYESLDWLKEQAMVFVGERANFLPVSVGS